jgi:hypothetical protein
MWADVDTVQFQADAAKQPPQVVVHSFEVAAGEESAGQARLVGDEHQGDPLFGYPLQWWSDAWLEHEIGRPPGVVPGLGQCAVSIEEDGCALTQDMPA